MGGWRATGWSSWWGGGIPDRWCGCLGDAGRVQAGERVGQLLGVLVHGQAGDAPPAQVDDLGDLVLVRLAGDARVDADQRHRAGAPRPATHQHVGDLEADPGEQPVQPLVPGAHGLRMVASAG
jgi:hypothetical protein